MRKPVAFVLLCLAALLAVSASGCAVATGEWPHEAALPDFSTMPRSSYQDFVDAVRAVQPGDLPAAIAASGNYTRSNLSFDVNAYLNVLTHLTVWPGYAFDYIYYKIGNDGRPILYVRDANAPRYQTFADLSSNQSASGMDGAFVTDDTAAGFFQMFVIDLIGGQFYLTGQGRYADYTIICGEAGLADAANDPYIHDVLNPGAHIDALMQEQRGHPTKAVQQQIDDLAYNQQKMVQLFSQAMQLDLAPHVTLDAKTATVSAVVFSKFSGFSRLTVTFSREYPHNVISHADPILIPYHADLSYSN